MSVPQVFALANCLGGRQAGTFWRPPSQPTDPVAIRRKDAEYAANLAADEAEELRQYEAKLLANELRLSNATASVDSGANGYTSEKLLDDYYAERKARDRTKDTLAFIEGHSKRLKRRLPKLARDITHAFLLGYIATRREEGVGEVINKELGILRPALKLAYRSGLFDVDPAKVIPAFDSMMKPGERWVRPHEVLGIALILMRRRMPHRAAQMVYAIATGTERSALPRARAEDVRKDERAVIVHGSKRESRKNRTVPTPLPEQRALLAWALAHADGGKDGALFSKWTNANSDMKEACEELGIPSVCLNDLRRSYATWLGLVGIRDELLDIALGHKAKTVLAAHYRKFSGPALIRSMEEEHTAKANGRTGAWWLADDEEDSRTGSNQSASPVGPV